MNEEPLRNSGNDPLETRFEDNQEQLARLMVARFTRRLMELARLRLPQKDEPEDVVQSVFRTFFRRLDQGEFQFDSVDNLWNLLAQITVRKCTRQVRYWTAARRQTDRTVATECGELPHGVLSNEPQAEHLTMLREVLEQLYDTLENEHRQILLLTLQGADAQQISDETGVGLRTVQRTRESIRLWIMEQGGTD